MKSNYLFIYFLITSFMLAGTSCKKNNEGPAPQSKVVMITKDIDDVTTWYSDSVYVINKYDFYVNNTLTVQAGTVIKFHPSNGPDLTLGGSGTIIAIGTTSKPIIFTSYKDDDHGGDTNGDGHTTQPAAKDWGEINTNGLNGSKFEYNQFLYGGNSSYSATLTIYDGTATVKNCVFAHNNGGDATGWYGALDMSEASTGCTIQHNIFYDNIRPLSINTAYNIDDSNLFHNPDNSGETNKYNGIVVNTEDEISSAVSWQETEVAFVIDDNDWWIESGGSLSLADNVVLKFRPESVLNLDTGISQLINYNGSGVYFTSYKDDTKKGDTNGDGNITQPNNGDWGGIYNNNNSVYVNWGNVLYASH